ncbi:MAG TPA: ATP-binding cassette domain-containing protein [Cyclobacteriaceae bacterium]|nr:ATP-binding cassette domain-containing protein [Cyclobacteriaceae bacterium]HPW63886.1 ATP-binding cassette domain-containing protein [Cyclobacteriaceae bacterium]
MMETQSKVVEEAVSTGGKVVEIKHLKKSFNDRVVLKDVNLDLHDRENLAVLGRSGSGKSVLIKCMVGLLKADAGEIQVLGYNVTSLSAEKLNELRLQVGFSFQGSALYDSMTVRQNLEFPLKRNLGIYDCAQLEELVIKALKDVGLEHTIDQRPDELSGGMKKRIGIARTLILKPKIMLYDEPTSGLDPQTSEEINELILQVRERYNTASIIITHDVSCARQVSDRVIALIEGESKLEGTFEELRVTNDTNLKHFFNY